MSLLRPLVILLLLMVAYLPAAHEVEVEGSVKPVGMPRDSDKARAREIALREAWLQSGLPLIKDSAQQALFKARVEKMGLAELEAVVESAEPLRQATRRGFYRVTLLVNFKEGALEEAAGAGESSLLAEARERRIMVIIPEVHIGRAVPDPAGETELIRMLIEAGFRVVDNKQIEKIREIDLAKAKNQKADPTELLSIAKDQGCEYLIVGEAFSHELPNSASLAPGMKACQARVEARMFAVDTGDILLADGKDATDMASSELIAGKRALRTAATGLGKSFIPILLQRMESEKEAAQRVQFVLAGASFVQKEELKKVFTSLGEDVVNVRDVSYQDKRATIEVRSYLPSGDLTSALYQQAGTLSFRFEPLEATPGKVVLRVQPAGDASDTPPASAPPMAVNLPRPPADAAPLSPEEVERIKQQRWIALIIGLNDYSGSGGAIPDLATASNDAKELAEVLRRDYRFQVKLLIDKDASISNIQSTFEALASTLTNDDNVLIYYAGHGHLLSGSDLGLWNVADSKLPTDGIYNAQIKEFVRRLKARRVLLVSDSCYSGDFVRRAIGRPKTEEVVREKEAALKISTAIARNGNPSREVVSSGNLAPVPDQSSDGFCTGHSPFACALLDALKQAPPGGALSTTDIFNHIYTRVEREEGFNPKNGPQKGVIPGHQDGEFFLVRFQ